MVIKRSGADGSTFPLINEVKFHRFCKMFWKFAFCPKDDELFELYPFSQECLLGRAEGCDIRIQLPIVSKEHAKLKVKVQDGAVQIIALSKTNNTKLNGGIISNDTPVQLFQEDVFTIGDRHFR